MADSRLISDQNGSNHAAETKTPETVQNITDTPETPKPKTPSGPFNIKSFVAIISLIGVFLTTEQMLRFSVLTTLERRFSFTTSHNGVIVSAYDMGHVVLLVILSVFGSKIHRPRMCAIGGFLSAISGILWATPHFIYGSGIVDSSASGLTGSVNQTSSMAADLGVALCYAPDIVNGSVVIPTTSSGCPDVITGNGTVSDGVSGAGAGTETTVSFVFLFLSQCLLGAGLAPFLTVAITYLDDNTDPATSALGVSIFLSVASVGLVFGFLFGAVMTGVFVDLSATSLTPADPEWVGAWWLGSVVISIVVCFVTAPLLFFPRVLTPEVTPRSRHNSMRSTTSTDTRAEKMRPMLQRRVSAIDISEAPGNTRSLATNVVYLCTTFAMCAITYLSAALFPFLPKYLETQFNVEPMTANIITSIVTALAVATGTFTGGYIAAAKELSPLGSSKLVLVGVAIGVSAFTASIFLGCPTPVIEGMPGTNSLDSSMATCIINCSCAEAAVLPVCGGNTNYFSACHAGCTGASPDLTSFFNCSCVGGADLSVGEATVGLCDSGCITLIPYSILIFITTFTIAMGTSPIVAILIRSVVPEQKSLALGINNVLTSILAAIPGPMVYGKMIDSACSVTDTSCEGQTTCMLYDNNRFRFLLHGVTEIFLIITGLCMIVAYFRLRRTSGEQPEEERGESKMADTQEPEAEPMVKADVRV